MTEDTHTLGAGGVVTSIGGAGGMSYIIPVDALDGSIVTNLIRRVVFASEDGSDVAMDAQISLQDVAFMVKSLISFMKEDVDMLKRIPNGTIFFSPKKSSRPQVAMTSDLRAAAQHLIEVCDVLESMGVARVPDGQ